MFVRDKEFGEPQRPFRAWTASEKSALVLAFAVVAFLSTFAGFMAGVVDNAFISSASDMVTGGCAFATVMIGIDMLESRR